LQCRKQRTSESASVVKSKTFITFRIMIDYSDKKECNVMILTAVIAKYAMVTIVSDYWCCTLLGCTSSSRVRVFFLVHCSLVHDFSIFSDSFRVLCTFVVLQKCMMLE